MVRLGERPRRVGEVLLFEIAQQPEGYPRQCAPHTLPRTQPDEPCHCESMRNVRHGARVQLGKHSDRLLAHGHKAVAQPAELAVG